MNQLKIEYVDLEQLKPFVDNPRNHSERNVDDILQSMKRFGWTNPIIARRDDNMVIAGHGRIEAARLNGTEQVPVIFTDFTENDAKLYSITDNRTSETSDWDLVALNDLVKELDEMPDIDLADSGFTSEELDDLLADVSMDLDQYADKDADAVPDVPETAQTQTGDIWHLGPHRVLCGDATKQDDVERLMDGQEADLICTDPPYCSGGFQETGKSSGSVGTTQWRTHKQIANDRLSTRGYSALLKSAFSNVGSPYIYAFTDWRMWVYLFDIVESSGYGVRSMIVWNKGTPGMGRGWRSQHELIMWGAKETPPFDKHASGVGNVIDEKRTGNNFHTTEKPVELMVTLIRNVPFCSKIFDPFLGSGTTLLASEKTGRQCYGMELDPPYCDVIARRYVDFVGTHADAWLERDGQRTHYSEMFDVLPVQISTTDGSAAVSETAL